MTAVRPKVHFQILKFTSLLQHSFCLRFYTRYLYSFIEDTSNLKKTFYLSLQIAELLKKKNLCSLEFHSEWSFIHKPIYYTKALLIQCCLTIDGTDFLVTVTWNIWKYVDRR